MIPHSWGPKNGVAQLGVLGLQKGELLKLLPTLPLIHLPPMLGIDRRFRQATEILLSHLSGLVFLRKLSLKLGDLPDKAFGSRAEANTTTFSASTLDTLSGASPSAWVT
jgi:hypothetical protein